MAGIFVNSRDVTAREEVEEQLRRRVHPEETASRISSILPSPRADG